MCWLLAGLFLSILTGSAPAQGLEVRILGSDALAGPVAAVGEPDFTGTHAWLPTSKGVVRVSLESLEVIPPQPLCAQELAAPQGSPPPSVAVAGRDSAFVGSPSRGLFRAGLDAGDQTCERLLPDEIEAVHALEYRNGTLWIGAGNGLWRLDPRHNQPRWIWRLEETRAEGRRSRCTAVQDIEATEDGSTFAVTCDRLWISRASGPDEPVPLPAWPGQGRNSRLTFDRYRELLLVTRMVGANNYGPVTGISLRKPRAIDTTGKGVPEIYHDEHRLWILDDEIASVRWDHEEDEFRDRDDPLASGVSRASCTSVDEPRVTNGVAFTREGKEAWVLKPGCLLRMTRGADGELSSRAPEEFGRYTGEAQPWHRLRIDPRGGVWILGTHSDSELVHLIDPGLDLVYKEVRPAFLGLHLVFKPTWTLGQVALMRGSQVARFLEPRELFARTRRPDGSWRRWARGDDIQEVMIDRLYHNVRLQLSLTEEPDRMEPGPRVVRQSVSLLGLRWAWRLLAGLVILVLVVAGALSICCFPTSDLARRLVSTKWRYVSIGTGLLLLFPWAKRRIAGRYLHSIRSGGSAGSWLCVDGFPTGNRLIQVPLEKGANPIEKHRELKNFLASQAPRLRERLGAWLPVPINEDDLDLLQEGRELVNARIANNGDVSQRLAEKLFDQSELILLLDPDFKASNLHRLTGYFASATVIVLSKRSYPGFATYRK